MYKRKFNIYLIIECLRAKMEFNFNSKEKAMSIFLALPASPSHSPPFHFGQLNRTDKKFQQPEGLKQLLI